MPTQKILEALSKINSGNSEEISEKILEEVGELESERFRDIIAELNNILKAYCDSHNIEAVIVAVGTGKFASVVGASACLNAPPSEKVQERMYSAYLDIMARASKG